MRSGSGGRKVLPIIMPNPNQGNTDRESGFDESYDGSPTSNRELPLRSEVQLVCREQFSFAALP